MPNAPLKQDRKWNLIREYTETDEYSQNDYRVYGCPCCGWETGDQAKDFEYCPKCGHKMGGVEDHE